MSITAKLGQRLKLASAPLLLAGLGACASSFNADVSRFESRMPAPQGETFAVVADDPSLASGLEFALYADHVEAQMAKLGYTQAEPENASLLVRFDYGVDKGRERVRRSARFYDPFYDPWYGFGRRYRYSRLGYRHRRSAWGYGFYDPWFDNGYESYVVFASGIDMKIDRAGTGERLFEGKAQALSRSNRLQYLVPNLVEAMFTGFPGNSGETVRISVKPESKR